MDLAHDLGGEAEPQGRFVELARFGLDPPLLLGDQFAVALVRPGLRFAYLPLPCLVGEVAVGPDPGKFGVVAVAIRPNLVGDTHRLICSFQAASALSIGCRSPAAGSSGKAANSAAHA